MRGRLGHASGRGLLAGTLPLVLLQYPGVGEVEQLPQGLDIVLAVAVAVLPLVGLPVLVAAAAGDGIERAVRDGLSIIPPGTRGIS
jgi:hypothetical protein